MKFFTLLLLSLIMSCISVVSEATPKPKYISAHTMIKRDLMILESIFKTHTIPTTQTSSISQTCLAKTIYYEARGEKGMTDKFLSGIATLNRSRSSNVQFADTICGVVAQKSQYSWYLKSKRSKIHDKASWNAAIEAAHVILSHQNQIKSTITHFHTKKVHPKWAKEMNLAYTGTAHLFY